MSEEKNAKVFPEIEYKLQFDGCSKSNPGIAGAGAVIYKFNEEIYSKIQIKLSYQLITLINNNKKMETPMMAKKSLLKHRFQNCCLNE